MTKELAEGFLKDVVLPLAVDLAQALARDPSTSEKECQGPMLTRAEQCGFSGFREARYGLLLQNEKRSNTKTMDLFLIKNQQFFAIELKTESGNNAGKFGGVSAEDAVAKDVKKLKTLPDKINPSAKPPDTATDIDMEGVGAKEEDDWEQEEHFLPEGMELESSGEKGKDYEVDVGLCPLYRWAIIIAVSGPGKGALTELGRGGGNLILQTVNGVSALLVMV